MFSHIVIGTNDLAKATAFYDATFAAIGVKPGALDPMGRRVYVSGGCVFIITAPINGEPACHANGGTIGLTMASPEQTEAWHAAGLAAGGSPCEDPPGLRDGAYGKLYMAYLRDPDGHKLCALHRFT